MTYQFGAFTLDVRQCRLTRDGSTLALSPRPFDLLVALVARASQLVTRDELLAQVWSGVAVEPSSLNAAMSVLRQALGADAGALIETVPSRGYRFVAPVRVVEAAASGSAPSADNAATARRVLVVDDHAVVRIGVRTIVERTAGYCVVGEAGTFKECRERLQALQPDLLILDLMLGGDSTLSQVAEWLETVPGLRIVVLSMHEEDEQARRALAAGAHGYVMKSQMLDELTAAVESVSAGGIWVSARLGRAIVQDVIEGRQLSD